MRYIYRENTKDKQKDRRTETEQNRDREIKKRDKCL